MQSYVAQKKSKIKPRTFVKIIGIFEVLTAVVAIINIVRTMLAGQWEALPFPVGLGISIALIFSLISILFIIAGIQLFRGNRWGLLLSITCQVIAIWHIAMPGTLYFNMQNVFHFNLRFTIDEFRVGVDLLAIGIVGYLVWATLSWRTKAPNWT